MPRNYTAVVGTSTCFVLNLTTVGKALLQEIFVRDVYFDTIAFSFEIACDANLKRECEAVDNEAFFRLQMRVCFSKVGTRTEKAPSKVFQR